ncbi:MAG: helix-turn-helix transcriptional regulator [Boseongicola sp.]|nr:helix-turn-helix transcriptional regulator [Boseongicola sp.]
MNQVVTIPQGEFLHLKGIEEDGPDLRSAHAVLECIEAGEENLAAGTVIGRPLEGDSPPNAWREHCQVSQAELARQSRVNRIQSIDVEAGPKTGSAFTLNRLASALDVDLDDIVTSLR